MVGQFVDNSSIVLNGTGYWDASSGCYIISNYQPGFAEFSSGINYSPPNSFVPRVRHKENSRCRYCNTKILDELRYYCVSCGAPL